MSPLFLRKAEIVLDTAKTNLELKGPASWPLEAQSPKQKYMLLDLKVQSPPWSVNKASSWGPFSLDNPSAMTHTWQDTAFQELQAEHKQHTVINQ